MSTAQFLVRMPPELRDWVADAAKEDDRSMNSFIVFLLKRTMAAQMKNASAAVTAEAPN